MALALDDEILFSAESFKLNIPTLDGYKAARLDLRFSGSGILDRTNEDDPALLEAARLGREVRLIVTGTIATKTYALGTGDDEELTFAATVRVSGVEAGELA